MPVYFIIRLPCNMYQISKHGIKCKSSCILSLMQKKISQLLLASHEIFPFLQKKRYETMHPHSISYHHKKHFSFLLGSLTNLHIINIIAYTFKKRRIYDRRNFHIPFLKHSEYFLKTDNTFFINLTKVYCVPLS